MSTITLAYPAAPHLHPQPRRHTRPKLSLQLPNLSSLSTFHAPAPSHRTPLSPTSRNTQANSRPMARGLSLSTPAASSLSSESESECSSSDSDSESDTDSRRAAGFHPTGFLLGAPRKKRMAHEIRRVGFVEEVRVFYREFEDEVYNCV